MDFKPGSWHLQPSDRRRRIHRQTELEWVAHLGKGIERPAGSVETVGFTGLVVDVAGNVYATGTFSGTLDFDPDGRQPTPHLERIRRPIRNETEFGGQLRVGRVVRDGGPRSGAGSPYGPTEASRSLEHLHLALLTSTPTHSTSTT